MRAAWYERMGPAREVLIVGELPDPEPGPGEVRVRVHTSGPNPADAKRRSGWARLTMDFARQIPHDDGAGVIDAVGDGVDPARIGERVWLFDTRVGRPAGSAAEYVCLPARNTEPLPSTVDFAQGASLSAPGRTAHLCLFDRGSIAGSTVLVAGAAGAVGHAAVQEAKLGGATVIGTVGRHENREIAEAAGCDLVLDRRRDDVRQAVLDFTGGRGVDRIVEVDLAANMELDARVCAVNGTIAVYGTDSGHKPVVPVWLLMNKSVAVNFVLLYNLPYEEHRRAADDVNRWAAAGELKMRIGKRFALEDIALAHEAVEQGTGNGNVIVDIR
ncbi:NADPH:quinone reductase [Amycolatopsis sp. K13G38]|uniref:NADPH:quinone reductase n=1 Tax=Amycolatopsis acididurans TaxID=2724524 RepID=A0ABX1JB97_9PSEU|nr:NADPH:quinone reductase [Amycolatopsis acididurans]NKQ56963.1 NADPH:quinone reductase [Amycolatopsis acididurans]